MNKELEALETLKDLATKCIKYIKKNKPVDLWADTIKQLENGQFSYFIREMMVRYSSGVLLEYANQMLKKLDRSDGK